MGYFLLSSGVLSVSTTSESIRDYFEFKMIGIKTVLISDAVDSSCVKLLEENGIKVDYKLKLSKEQLIAEIPVRFRFIFDWL